MYRSVQPGPHERFLCLAGAGLYFLFGVRVDTQLQHKMFRLFVDVHGNNSRHRNFGVCLFSPPLSLSRLYFVKIRTYAVQYDSPVRTVMSVWFIVLLCVCMCAYFGSLCVCPCFGQLFCFTCFSFGRAFNPQAVRAAHCSLRGWACGHASDKGRFHASSSEAHPRPQGDVCNSSSIIGRKNLTRARLD